MAKNLRSRQAGGYTVFHWEGNLIGFAEEIAVTGVAPITAPVIIQPLDQLKPVEIVTSPAHTNGTITLTLIELYNESIWERLAGLTGTNDVAEIMRKIGARSEGVKITKIVQPPTKTIGPAYFETFYNCVISRIDDNETINIRTMNVNKVIEIMFAFSRKSWIKGGSKDAEVSSFF